MYLDYWLLISPSESQAQRDTQFTLSLLVDLGLQINLEKSKLTLSRTMTFIGATLSSNLGWAFLPQERTLKLAGLVCLFRPHRWERARSAQQLLGLMASTTSTIQHAQLKMRSLQAWYLSNFNTIEDHPQKLLLVPPELSAQLRWWVTNANLSVGRPFRPPQLFLQVTTDASPTGWGAHCNSYQIHGLWLPSEKHLHINHLELLAVIKAFRAFEPPIAGQAIQLVADNTTVMFYVNKQGGTHLPSLLYLTMHLWEWCYAKRLPSGRSHSHSGQQNSGL